MVHVCYVSTIFVVEHKLNVLMVSFCWRSAMQKIEDRHFILNAPQTMKHSWRYLKSKSLCRLELRRCAGIAPLCVLNTGPTRCPAKPFQLFFRNRCVTSPGRRNTQYQNRQKHMYGLRVRPNTLPCRVLLHNGFPIGMVPWMCSFCWQTKRLQN